MLFGRFLLFKKNFKIFAKKLSFFRFWIVLIIEGKRNAFLRLLFCAIMGAKRGGGGRMLGIYLSMLNSTADQDAFQALYEANKYKVFRAAQRIVENKL